MHYFKHKLVLIKFITCAYDTLVLLHCEIVRIKNIFLSVLKSDVPRDMTLPDTLRNDLRQCSACVKSVWFLFE